MSSPHEPETPAFKPIRLQRFLAQCGLGSRRDCEDLITAGRVSINGKTADQLGTTVDPGKQTVSLDGERLKLERKKYFILNKPSGFLCTSADPEGRRVVLDLFPQEGPRLFTVGRLDENTTGLIVVTNDGDLAQKLAHPRYRIFRTYKAQVAGQPKPEIFEQLRQGLFFTEGKFRVHSVKPMKKQKDSTWVEITMTEGQNREIRRLFARVGHKIMKLERIGYGPLRLGRLAKGEHRDLSRDELAQLHAVLDRNQKSDAQAPAYTDRPPRQRSRPDPEARERPATGRSATGRPGQKSPSKGKRFEKTARRDSDTQNTETGTAPRKTTGTPARKSVGKPGQRSPKTGNSRPRGFVGKSTGPKRGGKRGTKGKGRGKS